MIAQAGYAKELVQCIQCKELKHGVEEFYINSNDKPNKKCKTCVAARAFRFSKENPIRRSEIRKKSKRHLRLKSLGVSQEDYDSLLAKLESRCEICLRDVVSLGRPLLVDHCHVTAMARGLLCTLCNIAVTVADMNFSNLDRMRTYLSGPFAKEKIGQS